MAAELPEQDLPEAVATLRARIAAAAVRCDYAALQAIAREDPKGFSFTLGTERSLAAYWRRLESQKLDRPLALLVQILRTAVTRNEIGAYSWRSAYTERPTEADWNALVGICPREQIEHMKSAGSYLGYRTAISPGGRWLFFIAGD